MSITIFKGQHYVHADGDEYDVLDVSSNGVMFETSEDKLVYMDLPDLIESLESNVLTLSDETEEDQDDDGNGDAEEEEEDEDDAEDE